MSSTSTSSVAFVNAKVWTGDAARPWADALTVAGERISAVGSSAEVRKRASRDGQLIDVRQMMIVPGFVDAHVHTLAGGLGLSSVQLRDAATRDEFAHRIADFAARCSPGEWILRGDWDHEQWGGELPTRQWIDRVTPNNPVWINRHDGHMSLANGAALRAAGVTSDTHDIPGGTIVRDPQGEPTGILKDNAASLVERHVPPPTDGALDRALEAAMRYLAARGVTSVHHMGTWADLAVFERAHAARGLRTRIYAAVPIDSWRRLADRVHAAGGGDFWLRIGALKGFVDGSLGSHTAAMLAPFADSPADAGLLVNSVEDLERWTASADAAGLHVIMHAIGDRAVRLQLDIFERAARANGPRDRRFRIEHAQHLDRADVSRFGALDVIASMQPYHAIDDGRWAERLIGVERAQLAFPFRALLDAGARLAFGSDWFVAPPTPLEGIAAAAARRTLDGAHPDGWIPEQRIGVEDALRAYTSNGAYASFEEDDKGMLARGMLADFVVIDRDLTRTPPGEVADAKIIATVAGGRTVYAADEAFVLDG
jgi:predicted amidohydrolase YtcJ